MKRIYSIISLLLFAIIAMGQNVRPSLIYSDNPNMLEVDANGGRFTYRYRIFEANPDNIGGLFAGKTMRLAYRGGYYPR